MKDYIDTSDFSKEELLDMANLGILIKRNIKAGYPLNGAMSQKLARICPHCKIERPVTDYEKGIFQRVLHKTLDKVYDVNESGCDQCFKGYKNRIAIAEVLLITDEVRTAITNNVGKEEMRKLVYGKSNTHTILEDGLEKVALGETSFDEIIKLADLENDLAIHAANDRDAGIKDSDYENMPKFEIEHVENTTTQSSNQSTTVNPPVQNTTTQPEKKDEVEELFE